MSQLAAGRALAQLAAPLRALFPAGVVAAELTSDPFLPLHTADPEAEALAQARLLLSEREWQSIADCRVARMRDYTAGRLCAHRALGELGVEYVSLLSAPDRCALWPSGMSGSITHTTRYAAAAVGPVISVGSIGLDTERVQDVERKLWPEICTVAEIEQINRWPDSQRALAAALCFVAKEAFYKAQFALCGEPLDFDAVWVELPETPAGDGATNDSAGNCVFRVHPLRSLRLQRMAGDAQVKSTWSGRFRHHAPYVSAGIALPLV